MDHLDFQKLLFLYTREEEEPSYDFVPYKFGGFSFTSYADKRRLIDLDLLEDHERQWVLTAGGRQCAKLSVSENLGMARFAKRHAELRGDSLVREIYRRFPYYAVRSEIADRLLADDFDALEAVREARPPKGKPGMATIGYEGCSLETYLNRLLKAGVSVLCDVRRNPLSRKYGFSKGTLSKACQNVGIRYEHLPELGIASEARRGLETQSDYDALFETYERESLPFQKEALSCIQKWVVDDRDRVALTCFERRPEQCHRHCVAEALERQFGATFSPAHL